MRFEALPLDGAYLIDLEPRRDARGMFARAFCAREFAAHGLQTVYVQANLSTTSQAGTVRGMHFQRPPHAEVKLVRCVRGAIHDVIVDLREGSASFGQSYGTELSDTNGRMLYVPRGFAHGFQALTNDATTLYMVSAFYEPDAEGGVRHDDPALRIGWPLPVAGISEKDSRWPLLRP